MGTWTITIEGHGINHNGTPKDADEMAKAFVAALRQSGHTEVKGFFVYGPKLATPLEATMARGVGFRKLEPLAPICDFKEWVKDRNGHYARDCTRDAVLAKFDGQDIITVRCVEHSTDSHPGLPGKPVTDGMVALRPAVI